MKHRWKVVNKKVSRREVVHSDDDVTAIAPY